ncbi:16S rRNA (adenine(1518)-N(6)/adenine(1519)-N(6))-dimethyltransferase RsmA [uncultured Pseudoramibacter sp.]|uniref:16S rRNA (adenine(1518)-N(6)/adenine(1519)-N(6))- dimethyltransferase RsmA n=1 Tax=uncultured Pseudoramibacter sp. TaxID=1623493 RepID=UPI0025D62203|nr:16S rRNA (adenine(1518)-N(6)/adenine(1519)-N(6))-dimethyltransferase RsmA [uncultured Pseudoramibacter sp.]
MNLTSPSVISELMAAHQLHFNKQFGQNFLIDQNILEKIVDAGQITEADTVLEIGPGIGSMTQEMAARAHQVVTVEIDKKLIPVLEETLGEFDNIALVNQDFLKTDVLDLIQAPTPLKVVANLPYYITTPIIMKLLETPWPDGIDLSRMTFLVQKEVGERICAEPGSKSYGAFSVIVQYYADPNVMFTVPASVFMPRPKVDSIVISLQKRTQMAFEPCDKNQFFKVVKAAFQTRRKTLINSLSNNTAYPKDVLLDALNEAGIDPKKRAEQIDGEDFCRLSNILYQKGANNDIESH